MGDGDENTTQDMGKFIASMDQLREETGAHIMAVHHSGKDAGRGTRGSSSLKAAVDTEIALTRKGIVITAEAEKQRDMPVERAFTYCLRQVELGVDEDGDEVTSCVVEETDSLPKEPTLSGQQEIAFRALEDALAREGKVMQSDLYPPNGRCVSIECWKEYCRRHNLSDGKESAFRKAFSTAKKILQEKRLIRMVNNYVWYVERVLPTLRDRYRSRR